MGGDQIAADELSAYLKTTGKITDRTFAAIGTKCREISDMLDGKTVPDRAAPATSAAPCAAICT